MSSRERGRFPSAVRERDLPKPLRRARGAVMAAKGYEHDGLFRPRAANCAARAFTVRQVDLANEQWAMAVRHLAQWVAS